MSKVGKQTRTYRLAGHRAAKYRRTRVATAGAAALGEREQPRAADKRSARRWAPDRPGRLTRKVRRKGRSTPRHSAWGAFSSGVTTIATLITSLAAVAALLFTGLTLQQTRDQNQLAASGQITDRFNAAVTSLSSGTETIRIGGIYALQRIMQDSPRDQPSVIQVLAGFIREEAPQEVTKPVTTSLTSAGLSIETIYFPPALDIQTALTVLATRNPADDAGALIDLVGAKLTSVDLRDAHLADVDLYGADLSDSDLSSADLRDSNLANADLKDTFLSNADLASTDLEAANLKNAKLDGVILNGADLGEADFWRTSWCQGDKPVHPGGYLCGAQG